jgi:hypothetical protein
VIDAADTAFFVSAKVEASTAVGARFLHKTNTGVGTTESQQILSHKGNPHGRAIRLGYL